MDEKFKTIFISLCRNFSVRYILYTDIFQVLKNQGYRIILFFKDDSVEFYKERFKDTDCILEPVFFNEAFAESRASFWARLFLVTRKCLSGATEEMENSTDRVRLFQYEKQMSKNLRGWLEFQIVRFWTALGKRSHFVRTSLVALESFLFPGKMYDCYFKKYKPQMLIVSSVGYFIDPLFMRSAKRYQCKVASIVHSWDNPSTKDYRGAKTDHVIAWNELMKKEIEVFHDIPAEKIFVGGIAHWDFYFDGSFKPKSKVEFLKQYGLKEGRKLLFYGTSSHLIFRNTFDTIEMLLEKIRQGRFGDSVQLLVRLHPNYLLKQRKKEGQVLELFQERMDAFQKKYGDIIAFNIPKMTFLKSDVDMPLEDMRTLAENLYHADVLLNEYSTLMIEAAIFDKPIINVGLHHYRDTEKPAWFLETFTHIKRILKTDCTKNAHTEEELLTAIDEYLKNPSLDREKRKRLVEQEAPTNRGSAGKKIGEHLVALIEKKELGKLL